MTINVSADVRWSAERLMLKSRCGLTRRHRYVELKGSLGEFMSTLGFYG